MVPFLHDKPDLLQSQYDLHMRAIEELTRRLLLDINMALHFTTSEAFDAREYARDNVSVFRFLEQANFDLDAAHHRLWDTICWRQKQHCVLSLAWKGDNLGFFHKQDRLGRPVLVVRLAFFPTLPFVVDLIPAYVCRAMEEARQKLTCTVRDDAEPRVYGQLAIMIDLDRAPFLPIDATFLKTGLVDLIDRRFPGSVGSVYIVNFGWTYQGLWQKLAYLLDNEARGRISFPSSSELAELIPKESLLREFGGEDDSPTPTERVNLDVFLLASNQDRLKPAQGENPSTEFSETGVTPEPIAAVGSEAANGSDNCLIATCSTDTELDQEKSFISDAAVTYDTLGPPAIPAADEEEKEKHTSIGDLTTAEVLEIVGSEDCVASALPTVPVSMTVEADNLPTTSLTPEGFDSALGIDTPQKMPELGRCGSFSQSETDPDTGTNSFRERWTLAGPVFATSLNDNVVDSTSAQAQSTTDVQRLYIANAPREQDPYILPEEDDRYDDLQKEDVYVDDSTLADSEGERDDKEADGEIGEPMDLSLLLPLAQKYRSRASSAVSSSSSDLYDIDASGLASFHGTAATATPTPPSSPPCPISALRILLPFYKDVTPTIIAATHPNAYCLSGIHTGTIRFLEPFLGTLAWSHSWRASWPAAVVGIDGFVLVRRLALLEEQRAQESDEGDNHFVSKKPVQKTKGKKEEDKPSQEGFSNSCLGTRSATFASPQFSRRSARDIPRSASDVRSPRRFLLQRLARWTRRLFKVTFAHKSVMYCAMLYVLMRSPLNQMVYQLVVSHTHGQRVSTSTRNVWQYPLFL